MKTIIFTALVAIFSHNAFAEKLCGYIAKDNGGNTTFVSNEKKSAVITGAAAAGFNFESVGLEHIEASKAYVYSGIESDTTYSCLCIEADLNNDDRFATPVISTIYKYSENPLKDCIDLISETLKK